MLLQSSTGLITYKKTKKLIKGVTLIELLVVITIMMTMMSIVAPLAINTVDKASAQSEYLTFCNLLRRASTKAFVNGARVKIQLNKNSIVITKVDANNVFDKQSEANNTVLLEQTFEFLYFKETILFFNKNGMVDTKILEIQQLDKSRQLNLIALLEH
ncbi:prepilin-type N-terminal cleavage/methylation domain-containing protein [Thalassotalea sp. 1_MG-2023]|uniref:pilus assembly FimT family protein n=1 Tax=Thalassotalea sp. 1_MG-2023 TaxID=3062680 RepID=UPI0026E14BCE|nr:prepilin-type N-terminal cleavage/methylation domain-containing protein [Thalassotalea sp. 1_MG-2023]MDO6426496.1 prepilin-type N-terminal cleavage/methylation domain-containing protein [Thalassotalea sp. 1_MG-2023]